MAMLPFIGYHVGDYLQHWLDIGAKADADKLPKIYYVNWFRRDDDGGFLWPGFGENSRVLKWMCERVEGKAEARKTPIGYMPGEGGIDLTGLKMDPADWAELMKVDTAASLNDLEDLEEFISKFGDRVPREMRDQAAALRARLTA